MQILLSLLPRVSVCYSPPKTGWKHRQISDPCTTLLNSLFLTFAVELSRAARAEPQEGHVLDLVCTSTLSVLYYSLSFNSLSVCPDTEEVRLNSAIEFPEVLLGKTEPRINNYQFSQQQLCLCFIICLTILHFLSIQTQVSAVICWSYPGSQGEIRIFIFSSRGACYCC